MQLLVQNELLFIHFFATYWNAKLGLLIYRLLTGPQVWRRTGHASDNSGITIYHLRAHGFRKGDEHPA